MDFDPDELSTLLAVHDGPDSVIPALEAIQAQFGYLPREAMILTSERSGVPLSQIYSVATFYHAFSLVPRGRHQIRVCTGTACHVRGAVQVLDRLETSLGIGPGETTHDRQFSLDTVNCLGCCALGPVVVVDGVYEGQATTKKIDRIVRRAQKAPGGQG